MTLCQNTANVRAVLEVPIQSVFPATTAHTEAWHRQVVGRGVSTSSESIQILWSTCTPPADYTRFTPNHFVPLYPATNAHQLRPLTQLVPETASDTQQSFAVCDVDSAYQPALHSTGVDGVATAPLPTMELGAVLADDNDAADDDGAPSYRPSKQKMHRIRISNTIQVLLKLGIATLGIRNCGP